MISLLLFFISFIPFQNSSSDTLVVTSKIENVTVFRSQAQIERTADVSLKAGKTMVVFSELSESMVPNSIQLKGKGSFTLISLTNRTNFTEPKTNDKLTSRLIAQRDSLQDQITRVRAQIKVIDSNVNLLNSSNNIANNHKISAAELDALLDLKSKRLLEYENKKIALNKDINKLNSKVELINNKIMESGSVTRNSFKEVIAEIEVESPIEMEFSLQYLVYNSGWNPSYDIRSENVSDPLNITYKANIYQNTSYDWNDVQFTINSGDPSQNVQKPTIYPEFINFRGAMRYFSNQQSGIQIRNTSNKSVVEGNVYDQVTGEPLPGVTVQLVELQKGVATNPNGYFSITDIPNGRYTLRATFVGFRKSEAQVLIRNSGSYATIVMKEDILGLEEVMVTGVGVDYDGSYSSNERRREPNDFVQNEIIQNQEISNQTSFSYKIDRPYSVPSDGKKHTLEIKRENPKTDYIYATVPKLSQNAYLIGNLVDWDEMNLIEGEANVYFENSFVGSTYLDPSSLLDTLEISLGKDERIIVERKKLKDFEERRFFGSKTRESLSFEISIRNTKPEPIEIIVEDQIPVSTDESIKVSPKELSGGELNKQTGIITWKMNLAPNETKKLRLNFQIEYPKGKRINF